jgi:hypothetical protein
MARQHFGRYIQGFFLDLTHHIDRKASEYKSYTNIGHYDIKYYLIHLSSTLLQADLNSLRTLSKRVCYSVFVEYTTVYK